MGDSTKNASEEVGRLMDTASEKEDDHQKLKKEIKSLQAQTEKLKESLIASESELKTKLEESKQEKENAVKEVKKECKKLEQERDTVKKEIEDTKKLTLEKTEEVVQSHAAEVSRLNQTLEKKDSAIGELESK